MQLLDMSTVLRHIGALIKTKLLAVHPTPFLASAESLISQQVPVLLLRRESDPTTSDKHKAVSTSASARHVQCQYTCSGIHRYTHLQSRIRSLL